MTEPPRDISACYRSVRYVGFTLVLFPLMQQCGGNDAGQPATDAQAGAVAVVGIGGATFASYGAGGARSGVGGAVSVGGASEGVGGALGLGGEGGQTTVPPFQDYFNPTCAGYQQTATLSKCQQCYVAACSTELWVYFSSTGPCPEIASCVANCPCGDSECYKPCSETVVTQLCSDELTSADPCFVGICRVDCGDAGLF